MPSLLRRSRMPLLGLLVLVLTLPAQGFSLPEPDAALTPAEVVRIQLDALAHNDQPSTDAGIAVVWRFASPGNRAETGPLSRFTQMVHHSYAEMLGHRHARLLPLKIRDTEALQGVVLTDRDGIRHRYLFLLSRQHHSPCAGCWLTDGVISEPDQALGSSV